MTPPGGSTESGPIPLAASAAEFALQRWWDTWSNRIGDVDEFHIEWGLRDSFLRSEELWETNVRHRMKQLTVKVIFPAGRPPLEVWESASLTSS